MGIDPSNLVENTHHYIKTLENELFHFNSDMREHIAKANNASRLASVPRFEDMQATKRQLANDHSKIDEIHTELAQLKNVELMATGIEVAKYIARERAQHTMERFKDATRKYNLSQDFNSVANQRHNTHSNTESVSKYRDQPVPITSLAGYNIQNGRYDGGNNFRKVLFPGTTYFKPQSWWDNRKQQSLAIERIYPGAAYRSQTNLQKETHLIENVNQASKETKDSYTLASQAFHPPLTPITYKPENSQIKNSILTNAYTSSLFTNNYQNKQQSHVPSNPAAYTRNEQLEKFNEEPNKKSESISTFNVRPTTLSMSYSSPQVQPAHAGEILKVGGLDETMIVNKKPDSAIGPEKGDQPTSASAPEPDMSGTIPYTFGLFPKYPVDVTDNMRKMDNLNQPSVPSDSQG